MSRWVQREFEFEVKPTEFLSVDEIFERADGPLLKQLAEDRRLERKSAGIHANVLGTYLSMWANTSPDGGVLVIGQEDDGSFSGCSKLTATKLNRLEKCGDDHCPGARYETKRVAVRNETGESDFVLLFRVFYHKDRVVETAKGDAFIRRGDSRKRLRDEERRELRTLKGEIDYEQEPCLLDYPADFDLELIAQFAESVQAKSGISARTDTEILAIRHLGLLGDGVFTPNLACALLFAKEPDRLIPGCKIRFFRFDGEKEGSGEKFNAVKDIWVESASLPKLIQQAGEVIEAQLRIFSVLGKDGKFYTTAEYPKPAWYEAVVNACVHRSYGNSLKNVHITVKMFDDRMEIESPGAFPPFVTSENIYGNPHPRNPKLMFAMYFMEYVKMAAEGTRRMRDTMRELELPDPEFAQKEISHSRVRVILRNNIKQRRIWVDSDVVAVIGEAIAGNLSQDEKRIVNFVAEHAKINVSQVQRLTLKSWHACRKMLDRLVEVGILEHVHRKDIDRDPQAYFVLKNRD